MPFDGPSRSWFAGYLRTLFVAFVICVGFAASVSRVQAHPASQGGSTGETIFQAKCTACHTIGGGKLVGPDLKDVTTRRDPQWIKSFIADPNKMFAANDPTALQLLGENNNVKMPSLGLSAEEIDALVAFLDSSGSAAGAAAPPPAALAGNPAAGQLLFTGEAKLAKGGPACISCHAVSGVGVLGGGTLGPDLTHAAQRYPAPGLSAVLGNIAFPTMIGPFTNRALMAQEQADLVAFLTAADQAHPPAPGPAPSYAAGAISPQMWQMFAIGLAGALVLTVLLAFFWPRQRQSLSAQLRRQARVDER